MTRRTFVGAMTFATAAGGLGLGSVFFQRRRLPVSEIVGDTVFPLRGHTVELTIAGGGTIRALVEDVHTVRRAARFGAPGTEQTSLLLNTRDPQAQAGIYRLDGDEVSLGGLYFSPVGPAGPDRRLEAVITSIV
jgi:hypothetical protein